MKTNVAAAIPARPQYFPALTGLRAVSALMVFFYHIAVPLPVGALPMGWGVLLMRQFDIGVTIFFVLSGFLIANRYFNNATMDKAWVKRYLQNRFARIYPLYFLLTVLTFGHMVLRPTYDWDEWPATYHYLDKVVAILLNLSLTRAYSQDMVFIGVSTAWSLTVEESFYLCAPFLLLGLKRSVRRLIIYPIILLIIGALLVWFCTHFVSCYRLMASIDFMLISTFFGRGFEFMVGMGLAIWLVRHQQKPLPPASGITWRGSIGIGLCIAALALTVHFLPEKSSEAPRIKWLIYNVLLPFPTVALFYGLINEQTQLRRLLQTPVFDLLGRSSYAFYLIHIGVVNNYFLAHVSSNWMIRLVGLTLVSIALYKWVEHPLHKLLRSRPHSLLKPVAKPSAFS